ncbi:hypothetical protein [Hungatella sp.]|jgi:predicted DNA-binding protein|uniref:hypothetical protein n=1 Tax=Hungatella sp. TaxID=2613924 RepID=UPI002A82F6D5|nr:hypothetical protein [Hungatella sp.]
MPTNKPKLQVILEEETFNKLKELAEKDRRSLSQMGGLIIEKYIEEYETQQEREEQKNKFAESSVSKIS